MAPSSSPEPQAPVFAPDEDALLLDLAAKRNAKVVEDLVPHLLPLGEVIKVFKNLLGEGVSIRT